MPRIDSDDYRDYVIKNGRFVGEFEQMYRNCEDPWRQDAEASFAEEIALMIVRGLGSLSRIVDLGCGKGRFSARVHAATAAEITAFDISDTAVQAARERYPAIDFRAARIPPLDLPPETADLVISAELLWYVLPDLKQLAAEIGRVLKPRGYWLIIQHFYQPGQQGYGGDVMTGPADLLQNIQDISFQTVRVVEVDRFSNHKIVALMRRH